MVLVVSSVSSLDVWGSMQEIELASDDSFPELKLNLLSPRPDSKLPTFSLPSVLIPLEGITTSPTDTTRRTFYPIHAQQFDILPRRRRPSQVVLVPLSSRLLRFDNEEKLRISVLGS